MDSIALALPRPVFQDWLRRLLNYRRYRTQRNDWAG
jgi:hypothetical protein